MNLGSSLPARSIVELAGDFSVNLLFGALVVHVRSVRRGNNVVVFRFPATVAVGLYDPLYADLTQ